jgi:hypothetical protein
VCFPKGDKIMKRFILLYIVFLGAVVSNATAQTDCTGSEISNISTFINNKLVCGNSLLNSDRWQEEHVASGQLIERAKGPNDPVDPRHVVGTWGVENRGGGEGSGSCSSYQVICYTYNSDGKYCFRLFNNGGTSSIFKYCSDSCSPTEIAIGKISPIPASDDADACNP